MILPGFTGGSYVSQSPILDQEETINYFYEQSESNSSTSPSALYPTPGVTQIGSMPLGPGRGHFFDAGSGREFAVIGSSFVEISSIGVPTVLGTVAVDSYPATISSNGPAGGQIFVTSGNNGYILTLSTNVFVQERTGQTRMGGALDGYFMALDPPSGTLFISNLLDGTTWNPTQFIQRSAQADPWTSFLVSPANRYIYLWGLLTGEVWYDAGNFPIPFALNPSGAIPYGCAAPFSPAVCDAAVVWVGSTKGGTGTVLSATGLTATNIGTYPVTYALDNYPLLSDAISFSYSDLGHLFYILTFPTANQTWSFDFTTSTPMSWTKRGTWQSGQNQYTYLRHCYHAFAYGQHRMLDLQTGAIYQMSSTLGADVGGGPIRRVRRAPGIQFERQRIFYSAFELDMECGLGNSVDPGSNPQVMLRMSNDGGKTWGNEHLRSGGAIGAYGRRVRWNRLGAARRRVFEIVVSDPIPWRIMNAYITPLQKPGKMTAIQGMQWEQ
jgi:hypothetical protein